MALNHLISVDSSKIGKELFSLKKKWLIMNQICNGQDFGNKQLDAAESLKMHSIEEETQKRWEYKMRTILGQYVVANLRRRGFKHVARPNSGSCTSLYPLFVTWFTRCQIMIRHVRKKVLVIVQKPSDIFSPFMSSL